MLFVVWTLVPCFFATFPHSPTFELGGERDSEFYRVKDVAMAADGSIWTLARDDAFLRHYTPDGSLSAKFAGTGDGPGELRKPHEALVVDDELWVCELETGRISVFAGNRFVRHIKLNNRPRSLVEVGGHIVAAPSFRHEPFVVLAPGGQILREFHLEDFTLPTPSDGASKNGWEMFVATATAEGLALNFYFMPVLVEVDLQGRLTNLWQTTLYEAHVTRIGRGSIPAYFASRGMGIDGEGMAWLGVCAESGGCPELLVLDLKRHAMVRREAFPESLYRVRYLNDYAVFITGQGHARFFRR
ncbi:hypothetical protein SCOR_08075 [Sulfidibacter corallicola]